MIILLIGVNDIRILLIGDYEIIASRSWYFIFLRVSDVIVLIVFTWYLLKIILPAVMLALGLDKTSSPGSCRLDDYHDVLMC